MNYNEDNLIDRQGFPTLEEIERYVDQGNGGSFKSKIYSALKELHKLADHIDANNHMGSDRERIVELEKALMYYAEPRRYVMNYHSRTKPDTYFWVFHAAVWMDSTPPHQDAHEKPWITAERVLS